MLFQKFNLTFPSSPEGSRKDQGEKKEPLKAYAWRAGASLEEVNVIRIFQMRETDKKSFMSWDLNL